MRGLITALCTAIALAGCQTIASIDATVQEQLPAVCTLITTAHAAFIAIDAARPLPANMLKDEAAAYAGAAALCADPSHTTVANALVKAAEVYAAITRELRAAEKVGG